MNLAITLTLFIAAMSGVGLIITIIIQFCSRPYTYRTEANPSTLSSIGRSPLALVSNFVLLSLLTCLPNIANALCSQNQTLYVDSRIYDDYRARADIAYALREIDQLTGGRNFRLQRTSNPPRTANATGDGVNSLYLHPDSNQSKFAVTTFDTSRNSAGKCVSEADIRVNKTWWDRTWIRTSGRYDDFEPDGKYTDWGNFRLALTHEFGHVIGLPHIDGWPNIMNSSPRSYTDIYANDAPTFDGQVRNYYARGGALLRGIKSAYRPYNVNHIALRPGQDDRWSLESRLTSNNRGTISYVDNRNNTIDVILKNSPLDFNLHLSNFSARGFSNQRVDVWLRPINGGSDRKLGSVTVPLSPFEDVTRRVRLYPQNQWQFNPNTQYQLVVMLPTSSPYRRVAISQYRYRYMQESQARDTIYNNCTRNHSASYCGSKVQSLFGTAQSPCVDPDGDGWGWDGTKSCRM